MQEGILDCKGPLYGKGKENADAFVSGSTGAVIGRRIALCGRSKGVERQPLAPLIPTEKEPPLLIDWWGQCGMPGLPAGAVLVKWVPFDDGKCHGIKKPQGGQSSISGAEEEKGNALVKETFPVC